MTTLELYRKHRKGEVSRDRFLYEVRRDSNLPWVTNTTSYDDAVKILKNKGIIREAQFEPQNITTDPAVDRVNPYALKREVEKLLAKEKVLTNDSYKEALNKAAKKLANPQAVKAAMFANADSVAKADANLQTQEVKKANHVDKKNAMKKAKGQQTPKATAAPTKENRKTKKPKGVEIMPDKGVEGSEKIIKEISEYLKKKLKLSEHNPYNEFHDGMSVETADGPGVVIKIMGGTLEVKLADGRIVHEQMNTVQKRTEAKKEQPQTQEEIGAKSEYESGFVVAEIEADSEELEVGDKVEVVYGNEYQGQIVTVKDIVNGFLKVEVGTLVTKEELEEEDIDDLNIGEKVIYDGKKVKVLDFDEEGNPYLNLGEIVSMHISDVKKIEDDEDEDEDLEEGGVIYTDDQREIPLSGGKNISQLTKQAKELEKTTGNQLAVRDLTTGIKTRV